VLALGLDCRVLALGDDWRALALGVDCRSPDGPVGLSCEPPDERGVVDADRFGVVDPCRVDAEPVRWEAAVDWFAPEP
jgi:hypothetical protein